MVKIEFSGGRHGVVLQTRNPNFLGACWTPPSCQYGHRAGPGDIGCLIDFLLGLPSDRYSEYGAVPKAQEVWLRAGRPPRDGPSSKRERLQVISGA